MQGPKVTYDTDELIIQYVESSLQGPLGPLELRRLLAHRRPLRSGLCLAGVAGTLRPRQRHPGGQDDPRGLRHEGRAVRTDAGGQGAGAHVAARRARVPELQGSWEQLFGICLG